MVRCSVPQSSPCDVTRASTGAAGTAESGAAGQRGPPRPGPRGGKRPQTSRRGGTAPKASRTGELAGCHRRPEQGRRGPCVARFLRVVAPSVSWRSCSTDGTKLWVLASRSWNGGQGICTCQRRSSSKPRSASPFGARQAFRVGPTLRVHATVDIREARHELLPAVFHTGHVVRRAETVKLRPTIAAAL